MWFVSCGDWWNTWLARSVYFPGKISLLTVFWCCRHRAIWGTSPLATDPSLPAQTFAQFSQMSLSTSFAQISQMCVSTSGCGWRSQLLLKLVLVQLGPQPGLYEQLIGHKHTDTHVAQALKKKTRFEKKTWEKGKTIFSIEYVVLVIFVHEWTKIILGFMQRRCYSMLSL